MRVIEPRTAPLRLLRVVRLTTAGKSVVSVETAKQ